MDQQVQVGRCACACTQPLSICPCDEKARAEAEDFKSKLNLERKAHENTRTDLAKARKANVALRDKLQKAREDKEHKVAKMHEQQKVDIESNRALAEKEIAALLDR